MKIYRYILIPSLVASLTAFANEELLSATKQQIIQNSLEKAIEDSNKLQQDWITPITYKYIYNEGEKYHTKRSTITVSQPIFKSGGIYYAIKYASSVAQYSATDIETQKKELIKQVVSLLYQIKKLEITLQKQHLLIENAKIDVQRKKEQVLNGILDTSFLDNAIIEANLRENTLIDLEYQKIELLNNLANLSDKKYEEMTLPIFSFIDDQKFIEENLYIKRASEDMEKAYWVKNMVTSSYLPSINFTADYTKYHEIDNNPALSEDGTTNVGFNITIPLDIRVSYDIQSNKIAYLQKKLSLEDKKREESNLHKTTLAKIDALEKKIEIAKSDVELYDSLLTQLQEQLSVGMKTVSDVQTMENSKKIKALDTKSLDIEIQLELLELYSRLES